MEFINSYVSHLMDIGILSTDDSSNEKFLNKLLYSEDIDISDFDQRSVICLQQHIQSLDQQQLLDMSQKIFESWHKKQNEVIHIKLSKIFNNAELNIKHMLRATIVKWKHQVEVIKQSEIQGNLMSQIDQLRKEVKMEREEREQYQKKLQARNQAQKSSQILDYTQNSQKDSQLLTSQQSTLQFAQTPLTKPVSSYQPMILDYSQAPMKQQVQGGSNNNLIYVTQKNLQDSSYLKQSHANLVDSQNNHLNNYQQISQTQEYQNNMSSLQQQQQQHFHHMYNQSNGSKTEFDPMSSMTHRQSKSNAQQMNQFTDSIANLHHQHIMEQDIQEQDQQDLTDQNIQHELINQDQIYHNQNIEISPKKQIHQQPQKQSQQIKPLGENHRFSNERIETPGSDNEIDQYRNEDLHYMDERNVGDNLDTLQNQINASLRDKSPSKFLVQQLQKQSREDRMRFILEKVIQEKFQGKTPDHLSPTQHRELEHLVSFINKINEETNECTFHPQINPKTRKIMDRVHQNPLQKQSAQEIFQRLHKESEMKQYNFSRYQEIKDNNEMIECTFSPKTNSPKSEGNNFSPSLSINRLHYKEIQERNDKLSKKEAEKQDQFRKDYTFKPERIKTKKLDNFLVKSPHNKENNEQSDDMYERLYRNHYEKEEKLEMKRHMKAQQEIQMINTINTNRSKSGRRRDNLELQNISNHQQVNSFYPQSTKNSQQFNNRNDNQKILSPQSHSTFANSNSKKYLPHFSSTISFQSNLRNESSTRQSQNNLSKSKNFTSQGLSQSISQTPDAFNRLYQNAQQSSKRKEKLRHTIDQEIGMSFSPKMFKPSSKVAQPSPQSTVVDRNEQFLKNKLLKIQMQEEEKYKECSFEPNLIAKNSNKKSMKSRVMQSINLHQQKLQNGFNNGNQSRCDISGISISDNRYSYNSQTKRKQQSMNLQAEDQSQFHLNNIMQEDYKNRQRVEIEQKMKSQYMKIRNKGV
eukprot:403357846